MNCVSVLKLYYQRFCSFFNRCVTVVLQPTHHTSFLKHTLHIEAVVLLYACAAAIDSNMPQFHNEQSAMTCWCNNTCTWALEKAACQVSSRWALVCCIRALMDLDHRLFPWLVVTSDPSPPVPLCFFCPSMYWGPDSAHPPIQSSQSTRSNSHMSTASL